MKCRGMRNVSKHREIKNVEKYIILDISSKIDCLDKRKVTSSESKYYMVIPGKELTASIALRTKNSNKKQKSSFNITDIINQEFRKFLNKFNNLPDIG